MPYDYEIQRRKMMELLARINPTPQIGNDSGGNNGVPMGQYVPGYPPNQPQYYDGKMPRKMIKGGRRRKR